MKGISRNTNPKVKIFRYVTEGTFDAYSWQLIENKQKFIGQIMTSKSPVRSCEDIDEAALTYAEVKALATGNPYIKEKMDLDIQVSKLKLMKANHTSQKYRLEDNIAKNYPQQISALKKRISGMKADIATYNANKPADKDIFTMTVAGKTYDDRKEAGTAIIGICKEMKQANVAVPIGEYLGMKMNVTFDSFFRKFTLNTKGKLSHEVEIGSDPSGNITRIGNAMESMSKQLEDAIAKLANVEQQLETAKIEVEKPFPQEQEFNDKLTRLAELNSLLDMDEKGENAVDLDVVLYYSGSVREDDLFNTLNQGNIIMGGVKLDINTISQEQHGSLSECLTGVEAYLAEKQAQMMQEAQQRNTEITYTVAECGEFHSMGAYHEGIATIEEAKALFESIRENHSNMIPAVGIKIHEAGTAEIDDMQMDVLYGSTIDLDDLRYVPQIWNDQEGLSKVGQIIDTFPDAKVIGELPGLTVQDRAQPDMDAIKLVYVDEAAKLAAEIDRFSSDFDPYEYKDTVDNWELQVKNIADDIRNGNAADYKKYLGTVIAESDNIEDVRKAAELLVKLAEYKPLAKVEELEEVNLNQIDNVLSNTVPKSEEKREARQAEQERLEELQRIEEEERKRRARGERPSLRARLADKKAIVAANSAVPQRSKQREAQEAVVSQRDI